MTNARSKQDVVLEGGPAPPGAGTRVWRGDERQDGAVGPAQGSASRAVLRRWDGGRAGSGDVPRHEVPVDVAGPVQAGQVAGGQNRAAVWSLLSG